ncbi:MAG: site-specific integrase [Phycisphaerales bacterium]|nr:MAG: site-specific integrase [Phycisphaerales bacterium]
MRWYAPDGTRPRQSFDTREEAEDFARGKVAEFEDRGLHVRVQPKRIALGDFVDEVLRLRTGPRGQRLSIMTTREYRTVLERFVESAGRDTPLDCITMADATRYIAGIQATPSARDKPLSTSSVNKHKRVLKRAFNVAVTQLSYLHSNPFAGLTQDKVADQAIRYVEVAEYDVIIETCQSMQSPLWWECFITVCYTAGARLNEAAHLSWRDIDFEANTIRIGAKPELAGLEAWRPKDYDSRTIPVPSHTMDLLIRLHAEAEEGSEFVFIPPVRVAWIRAKRKTGEWAEGQAVLNNVTKNFQRRAGKAGVTDVTIHDLRRSCITHWARKLAVPIVKELAGHSDINTTLRYYVAIRDCDMAEARSVTAHALSADRPKVDPEQTQGGQEVGQCDTGAT